MIQPLSPAEIVANKESEMPDEVIIAFNKLLTRYFDGTTAIIKQDAAIDAILEEYNVFENSMDRQRIFADRLLDIEVIFRKFGWDVHYDKPGYNEMYTAFWRFSKKPI